MIKSVIDSISEPISFLFNQSIENGVFPSKLKCARVVPVFKSGNKCEIKNYRPISTLPFLSKIFEKLTAERIYTYLNKENIISDRQYGFQKNIGTIDAIIRFMDRTYTSLSKKEYVLSVFVDFSKAFDTLSHDILLSKLHYYGFRGIVYDWFASYLSNRQQRVDFKGSISPVETINTGIPQGSVLGPLLFILYINDLINASKIFDVVLYADDATLLYSDSCINNLFNVVNNELNNIFQWTCANKLSLNIDKTKYMVISTKTVATSGYSLILNDNVLEQVRNFNFLGILIDDKLTFKDHIKQKGTEIERSLGILKKVDFLPTNVLRMIYFSIIYSKLIYGIVIWGSAAPSNLISLSLKNKKAIRRITKIDWLAHTSPLFKSVNILKLNDIYKYFSALFMYKLSSGNINNNFYRSKYELYLRNHNYHTRYKLNLNLPYFDSNLCQRSIFFQAGLVWNLLPETLKDSRTVNKFKTDLKKLIIDKY